MSELRQDPTTKEWVIIAPERGKRPQQKSKRKLADELPPRDESCPFCTGNESKTPQEVFRLPLSSQESSWQVRVVPNRFAALTLNGDITRREDGHFFRKMNGIGIHELARQMGTSVKMIEAHYSKITPEILEAFEADFGVKI